MALAKWFKVDFHTHSPASNCFRDKTVTAKTWVEAAKAAGLDAVVLTDHNSVAFMSDIEALDAADKEGLKIFYGVELCVSATFTHILIVFDDKLSKEQIEDAVVGNLQLKREHWGDTEFNVSEEHLKNLCTVMREHILIIPAHFASEKGLGRDKINAIKKYKELSIQFDAIEIRNENDGSEYRKKVHDRVLDEGLALVTGSDNPSAKDQAVHSIEGFGAAFTWVKAASPLTFDGLRQMVLDPDSRCINMLDLQKIGLEYNPNEVVNNYVSGIKIQNMVHIPNLDMRFSSGLNCIVGGRGTGKSTVVDAICYGLNCRDDFSDCKLLEKTMQPDGKISTFFNFGSSKNYLVETTRKDKELIYSYYDNNGEVSDPPEFKIDFYGQKEIYRLLNEDEESSSREVHPLIKMIDDRIETKLFAHNDKTNTIIEELKNYATKYKGNRRKIAELSKIRTEVEKAEAILARFKASGIEEKRRRLELVSSWIKETQNDISLYLSMIITTQERVSKYRDEFGLTLARLKDEPETNKDGIVAIEEVLSSCDRVMDRLLAEEVTIETKRDEYELSDIHQYLRNINEDYLAAIDTIKVTGAEEIQTIQEKLQENRIRMNEIQDIITSQNDIKTRIVNLIDQLVKEKIDISELRRNTISEMHLDNVKYTIASLANANRLKFSLQKEFKRESYEDEFAQLADRIIKPDNDFEMLKKYILFLLTSETGDLEELDIHPPARFNSIWKDKYRGGTLDSLINFLPEDKVDISIVENGNETDINNGSPGQKCAALLAFILNSGNDPLIIDQPEDDLDNSLIYNLVVKTIRKIKKSRQIIIVTHNPNIPVLGDAEGIIILERDESGKVGFRKAKKAGCIEEALIRQGICDIMEGGEEAFRKRERKYLGLN